MAKPELFFEREDYGKKWQVSFEQPAASAFAFTPPNVEQALAQALTRPHQQVAAGATTWFVSGSQTFMSA